MGQPLSLHRLPSQGRGRPLGLRGVGGAAPAQPHTLTPAPCTPAACLYCFPAISLLGLFPQVDTFCIYLLEQIDMLLFGGSGESRAFSSSRGG